MTVRSRLSPISPMGAPMSGFSLLELSVVMIIMALVLSALLSLGTNKTLESKRQVTEERLAVIRKAIGLYAFTHHALPCPATGSLPPGDSNYGRAVTNGLGTSCASGVATVPAGAFSGTVPIVSLGLSDEYMLDGWNRRITYVVDTDFIKRRDLDDAAAANRRGGMDDLDSDSADQIALQSLSIFPQTGGTQIATAAVVLISHGPNGHGAYGLNGGAVINILPSNLDTQDNEWENAGNSSLAPTADSTVHNVQFIMMGENTGFDDVVSSLSRSDIIELAGGIVDQPTCAMLFYANQTLNETTAVPQGPVGCTGSPGVTAPSFICVERQLAMSQPLLELCFIVDQ